MRMSTLLWVAWGCVVLVILVMAGLMALTVMGDRSSSWDILIPL